MGSALEWIWREIRDMFTLDYWIPKGDKLLWIPIIILALSSLLFIYSSTGYLASRLNGGAMAYYLWKQIIFLIAGYVVIMVVQRRSFKAVIDYVPWFLLFGIGLMILAWILGDAKNSAGRWIVLGPISFQPSEVVKLATIMFIARDISYNQTAEGYNFSWKRMILPLFAILLIFKDNISTAILLSGTCFMMICIGRLPWRQIAKVVAIAIGGIAILVGSLLAIPDSTINALKDNEVLKRIPTAQSRIKTFFDPVPLEEMELQEIRDSQSIQAQITVASGGVLGKGPGNSIQGIKLPEVYSDFIFAIILEETGLWGMALIMIMYSIMLISAFRVLFKCKSLFLGLLVVGIVMCLLFQTIIHMFVCVGLFPVTGQTLPLLSKGGTSTLIVCLELGILLGVSNMIQQEEQQQLAMNQSANNNE
ncbi:MAG: FtsW/RodA/SpoVE family cell cycle protein [Odoribacter sp.]|nr:cell division protein FtsW [Bacteroidales bacterium]MBR2980596.1 FtsW/RodA/SpoVE family cell cycle protein [Odoribacter sp.]